MHRTVNPRVVADLDTPVKIKAFQLNHHLATDGIIGPATERAWLEANDPRPHPIERLMAGEVGTPDGKPFPLPITDRLRDWPGELVSEAAIKEAYRLMTEAAREIEHLQRKIDGLRGAIEEHGRRTKLVLDQRRPV